MNKFGTKYVTSQIRELREKAEEVKQESDTELYRILTDAADTIEGGMKYYLAVGSATV